MPAAELMSLFFFFFAIKKGSTKHKPSLQWYLTYFPSLFLFFTSSDLLTFITLKNWKGIPAETQLQHLEKESKQTTY